MGTRRKCRTSFEGVLLSSKGTRLPSVVNNCGFRVKPFLFEGHVIYVEPPLLPCTTGAQRETEMTPKGEGEAQPPNAFVFLGRLPQGIKACGFTISRGPKTNTTLKIPKYNQYIVYKII